MGRINWVTLCTIFAFCTCTNRDYKPSSEEKCRLGRYIYMQESGNDVSYHLSFNASKQIDLVNSEIFLGNDWQVEATYKYRYISDSLYINDFRQFVEGDLLMTVLLNEKIQEVKVYFEDTGSIYRYHFDYSKNKQITITLDSIQGEVVTFDSRGVYYFDDNADVIRLEIFRNEDLHGNDPDNFLYREKTFTYDPIPNPLRDLIIPNFIQPSLPDVSFFSAHNRLTEEFDGVSKSFQFMYGTDPMPTQVITPDGVVQKFFYPNCTN